jgi:hypothetical protein
MLTTRGLSPRYVRDLLTRAHELLRRVPEGASLAQLFTRLEIEGYNRHSLADLLSFVQQCPAAFTTIDDCIRADGTTVPEVENLGIDQAPVGPRKFESPGGTVWHLSRKCEWLWEGKRKAAEDGHQRYHLQVVEVSDRPACRYCTRDVTYKPG